MEIVDLAKSFWADEANDSVNIPQKKSTIDF
jgi:hypothetical protein